MAHRPLTSSASADDISLRARTTVPSFRRQATPCIGTPRFARIDVTLLSFVASFGRVSTRSCPWRSPSKHAPATRSKGGLRRGSRARREACPAGPHLTPARGTLQHREECPGWAVVRPVAGAGPWTKRSSIRVPRILPRATPPPMERGPRERSRGPTRAPVRGRSPSVTGTTLRERGSCRLWEGGPTGSRTRDPWGPDRRDAATGARAGCRGAGGRPPPAGSRVPTRGH